MQDFLKVERNREFPENVESKESSKKSSKRCRVVYANINLLQDFPEKLKAKLKAKNLQKNLRHAIV